MKTLHLQLFLDGDGAGMEYYPSMGIPHPHPQLFLDGDGAGMGDNF